MQYKIQRQEHFNKATAAQVDGIKTGLNKLSLLLA
jgi:hypothetical protein